jgi:hypothetical protein
MFKTILLSLFATLLPVSQTLAETVSVDRQQITANISNDMGQLLDWSATDRRIERIFFDNPEQFRKSFIFTTDGCKKDQCLNASLINISARPGSGEARSSLKVVLANRLGKKYIYTIRLVKVKSVEDGVIAFSPILIPSPKGNATRQQAVDPIYPNRSTNSPTRRQAVDPIYPNRSTN